jgi:hypothetical protein
MFLYIRRYSFVYGGKNLLSALFHKFDNVFYLLYSCTTERTEFTED